MQATQSIQVLPAVTDQANLFIGLNLATAGRVSTIFSSPALTYNPAGNLLTVANVSVTNSLGLGTGAIAIDNASGALNLIPAATAATANPIALVVLPSGGLGFASVVKGQVSASAVATAVTNAVTSGAPIGSLVKVYNFISSVTAGAGTVRWYPQSGITLVSCYLTAGTSPSIGSFSINLLKNGTAVQTISLNSGNYNTSLITLNITAGATDYFTVDVTSTGGASNGALNIIYQRTS